MNKDKKQLVALLPLLYESGRLELRYMNDIERWAPSFMAYRVDKAMKSFGFKPNYNFNYLPSDEEIADGGDESYELVYTRKNEVNGRDQNFRVRFDAYTEQTMKIAFALVEDNTLPHDEETYNHYSQFTIYSYRPDEFIDDLSEHIKSVIEELERSAEQIDIVFDEIADPIIEWARIYDLKGSVSPNSYIIKFKSPNFESEIHVAFEPGGPSQFGYELLYKPKDEEKGQYFRSQKRVDVNWKTNLYYIDELTSLLKQDLMEVVNNDLAA